VLEALTRLKAAGGDLPVIGGVLGPVTLAAMVMKAGLFLRLTRRDPAAAEKLIAALEPVAVRFALAQRAAGADCVTVAEPSATGEVMPQLQEAHFQDVVCGTGALACDNAGKPFRTAGGGCATPPVTEALPGEVLGGKHFEKLAAPALIRGNRLVIGGGDFGIFFFLRLTSVYYMIYL
jgi:hypothetical protein